jgi:hypothetical protein
VFESNASLVEIAFYRSIRVIDRLLVREYDKNDQIATILNDHRSNTIKSVNYFQLSEQYFRNGGGEIDLWRSTILQISKLRGGGFQAPGPSTKDQAAMALS